MEKPLFEYRNHLRNVLIATIWTLLFFATLKAISLTYFLLDLYTSWNPELSWIVILTASILALAIGWHIRFLRLKIYIDAIVFKEHGPHPTLGSRFGIAFENIYEYKITNIAFTFNWLVLKRRNGKTIRKLISIPRKEFIGFSDILDEKIKNNSI